MNILKRLIALWVVTWVALSGSRATADTVTVSGFLYGTNVWRTTNTYILDGFVYVQTNSILKIEPGTVIKCVAGTNASSFGCLFINRGAKIFAEGTPRNPIVFTAESDDVTDPYDLPFPSRGLWGGVVLFGNARINKAVNAAGNAATPKYEVYEGLADAQGPNGEYLYRFGGNDDEDSSGVLRYVSIRHGGKVFESNKEINGLSLGAVGRGTIIEYVEAYATADDGFEFFGGTVNTRYLVSAFNDDDCFDTDMGYSGKNQFWFAIQENGARDKGGEHNGEPNENAPGDGVPESTFAVYNATFVGAGVGAGGSANNDTFTWRQFSKGQYYNSVFTDFNGRPINGGAFATGASPTLQDNLWYGFTNPDFSPASLFDASNNNTTNANPLLLGISRDQDGGLDPRVQPGSPALSGYRPTPTDGFFKPAAYRGAFGTNDLWLRGWTFLSQGGFLPSATNIVEVPGGYITSDVTWRSTNIYLLNGFVFVQSNAVLRIEPGTVIKGVPGTNASSFGCLFVNRGAKIFAEGTPNNPIIFTAESDDVDDPYDLPFPSRGLWGGVVLFGNARINKAVNAAGNSASPKYEVYEGLADAQAPNGEYLYRFGGDNDDDSSGVLRYVSIRHGGKVFESNKEINGLSLGAVGRGTTIEFVEAYATADDGFEFFGGTVNTRYLVSAFNDDDCFDTDMGYSGTNQFWLAVQENGARDKGGEHNGEPNENATGDGLPASAFSVHNATFIGAGAGAGGSANNDTFTWRQFSRGQYYNSIFTDFNGRPINGGAFATGADPTLKDNIWYGFSNPDFSPAALFEASTGNLTNVNPQLRSIGARDGIQSIDPRPEAGSPANTSPRRAPNDGFHLPAAYYGAFTSSGNWAVDWTALGNDLILSASGSFNPVINSAPVTPPITVQVTVDGTNLKLTWTGGGSGPFSVEGRGSLSSGTWSQVLTTSERTASVPLTGDNQFLQVTE